MLELARKNKIDLILTKSISRFSRNIVDTLSILQELKQHHVEVFFEKENISSFDSKIEFVISVLSSMAQEESRGNLDNVKWSVRNKFKKGEYYFNTNNLLGYKRDKNSNIYIDQDEAALIRKIFDMYLSGIGTTSIAKHLTGSGYQTIKGLSKWGTSSVVGILKNEKYAGSALLQKTVRPSYLERKTIDNDNLLPKYYIEDSHEPIISKDIFNQVQDKFKQKASQQLNVFDNMKKENHYTEYAGLCECGHCGKPYRHKINNGTSKYARAILTCTSNETIKLDTIVANQINLIIKNIDKTLNLALQALNTDKALEFALKDDKEATQAQITATSKTLEQLSKSNNDLDKLAANELKKKLSLLKINYAQINNKFLIDYNLEIKMLQLKKTLNDIKQLNGNYKNLNFNNIFSKIVIKSRNEIVFYLNFRSFDNISKTTFKTSFNTTTEHFIRKTPIKTIHGVII